MDVLLSEQPLLIFVSSRMEEFIRERQIIYSIVNQLPLTKPWLFEFTPSSSEATDDAYLQKVQQCDIFILLVGESLSMPVTNEFNLAKEQNKPCLIFLKDCNRSEEVRAFVDALSFKWSVFSSLETLADLVRLALIDELIKGYRAGRQTKLSKDHLVALISIKQHLETRKPHTPARNSQYILTSISALDLRNFIHDSSIVDEICQSAFAAGFRYSGVSYLHDLMLIEVCNITAIDTLDSLERRLDSYRAYTKLFFAHLAGIMRSRSEWTVGNGYSYVGSLLVGLHTEPFPPIEIANELGWSVQHVIDVREAGNHAARSGRTIGS